MRYGREVIVGSQVRLTEVVEIAAGVVDAASWLATHFPHLSPEGWVEVLDANHSGDVKQEDGAFASPSLPVVKQEFKTLNGSEFIAVVGSALGFARLDELLLKSETVKALLLKAEKIDRLSGNTPKALEYLKTGANALADEEISSIDTAWKAAG